MSIVLHESVEKKIQRVLATLKETTVVNVKGVPFNPTSLKDALHPIASVEAKNAIIGYLAAGHYLDSFYYHQVNPDNTNRTLTVFNLKASVAVSMYKTTVDIYVVELSVDLKPEDSVTFWGYAGEALSVVCGTLVGFWSAGIAFGWAGWGAANLANRVKVNQVFKDELVVTLKAEFDEMCANN